MPHTDDSFDMALGDLINRVEMAEEATEPARRDSERDRDYYDGKQWTEADAAVLQKRGQAPIVINRVKPKADLLRGVERRLRSDPKAFPRTPVHETDADSATDAIRFVCDNNSWNQVRSQVWDNLVIEGMAGAEVFVEQMPNGQLEIRIKRLAWDRIGYDPHSAEPDFSDAKYWYVVVWMDEEDAKALWPDAEVAIESSYLSASVTDTYDDKPKFAVWGDRKRKRVRIVQMHEERNGEWWQSTFVRGGFLEEPEPSPYRDEFGTPESSVILASAYVDRDNNRYGFVRPMRWPQDEINKRRSKALHLLNVNRVVSDGTVHLGDGSKPDRNRIKAEAARPDAYFEAPPNSRFEVQTNSELAAGQLGLLQEAKGELDELGPNTALLGTAEGQSGRALQARQQSGLIELEPLTDAHRHFARRVYRAIWNRVRQFWTDERWIRVTDDENNLRWIGMNLTLRGQLEAMPPAERAQAMQELQLVPGDPRLDQIVSGDVASLDVDILLEEGPDIITIRQEQFDNLADLFTKGVLGPEFVDLLIEASDLRNKEAILDRLRGSEEDAEKAQLEEETSKMIQFRGADAEVRKTEAEAVSEAAKATEDMADARNKAFEAEAKRRQLGLPLI